MRVLARGSCCVSSARLVKAACYRPPWPAACVCSPRERCSVGRAGPLLRDRHFLRLSAGSSGYLDKRRPFGLGFGEGQSGRVPAVLQFRELHFSRCCEVLHRTFRKDQSTLVVLRLRLSSISRVMSIAKNTLGPLLNHLLAVD